MDKSIIHNCSIEDLSTYIRNEDLSPVELCEAYIERIDKFDGKIKSFACKPKNFLCEAQKAHTEIRNGNYKGPLHGIPIAVKDNYLTTDMPTFAGSQANRNFPKLDSSCVSKLRSAGAIIFGKTNMHEFAWGNETPPTRNPWDLTRVPGGSSGGSGAAIASGFVPAAMGSDTGGSIRIPASLCGTVGLKPTFGLVSRAGIIPHSWSLDHAGPLCAGVADAAYILDAIKGFDPNDPSSVNCIDTIFSDAIGENFSDLTIGLCRNHFFDFLQDEVSNTIDKSLQTLSSMCGKIKEIEIPHIEYGLGAIFAIELASSTAWHMQGSEKNFTQGLTSDVRNLIEAGRFVTGFDYLKAEQVRRLLLNEFLSCFSDIDIIISPTVPLTAWRIGENSVQIANKIESVLSASWRLTYPFNLVGLPAISLPCGFDSKGLPIGLQLASRPFGEKDLLRLSYAFEKNSNMSPFRPVLA